MADYLVKGESLTDLADKIRTKTGDSAALTFPSDFEDAIDDMVVPSGNQDITTTAEYDVSAKATARISAAERGKIIAENIKKDVTLLGVMGSYEGTDTSDATATSGDILDGKTAYAGGVKITGSIPTKTSADLTASGDTVTAPAGYYAAPASKAVTAGSVSIPGDTISVTPSISVSSGGLVSAVVTGSKTVVPSVTPGYVSSASSVVMPVVGTSTSQLPVQAAQTITPTTSDQTIASGKYLTGAQTIKGDANLIAGNIKKGVTIFGVTGTYEGEPAGFTVQITNSTDGAEWTDNDSGLGIYEYGVGEYITSSDPLSNTTRTFILPAGTYVAVAGMYEMNGSTSTGGVTVTLEDAYSVIFTVSGDGTLNVVGELE